MSFEPWVLRFIEVGMSSLCRVDLKHNQKATGYLPRYPCHYCIHEHTNTREYKENKTVFGLLWMTNKLGGTAIPSRFWFQFFPMWTQKRNCGLRQPLFPEEAPHCPFHGRCTIYTLIDTQKTQLLSILANICYFYDLFIVMVFVCMYAYVPCACSSHRESDFLELELQMVMSHHGSAGNQSQIDTLLAIFVFLLRTTLRGMGWPFASLQCRTSQYCCRPVCLENTLCNTFWPFFNWTICLSLLSSSVFLIYFE